MRTSICGFLLAAATLALPGVSAGYTCYIVYDRSGNTIFRDMRPPVDMSDRGAPEREALRNRGEMLLIVDFDRCSSPTFVSSPGDSTVLDLTSLLNVIPDAMPAGSVAEAGSRQSSGGGTSRRTTTSAPAAAAPSRAPSGYSR